jgi:hypothetical protein
MKSTDSYNQKIAGYIVFGFRKIRPIALIELRNGFLHIPDKSVNFFLDRMNSSTYSNHIDLKRYERLSQLSQFYAIYEIFYSIKEPNQFVDELKTNFDYLLVSNSENIVKDFFLARREFEIKCKSPTYCKIKDMEDLLDVYRNFLKIYEQGNLKVA